MVRGIYLYLMVLPVHRFRWSMCLIEKPYFLQKRAPTAKTLTNCIFIFHENIVHNEAMDDKKHKTRKT